MPVTPGTLTTYNQVRDWAIDAANFSSGCPVQPEVIEALLLDCLQQIHSQIWDNRRYQHEWGFSVLAGDTHALANAVYELRVGGHNEVQEVAVDATGGSFTLTFGGSTTAAILFNASASAVRTALEGIAPFSSGDIEVSGGPGGAGGGQPYVFTFTGQYARTNVAQFTASGASLTGGAGTATPSTAQTGSTPSGGTFTITVNDATTSTIAWNATPGQVQSALEALSTVAVGDVEVTGGIGSISGDFPYCIEFKGQLAGTAMTVSWTPTWTDKPSDLVALVAGGSEAPTSQIFDPMWRIVNKVVRVSDGRELYEAETMPASNLDADDDPLRLEWFTWGDEFTVSPPSTEDQTYEVFGYRVLDRTLYTVDADNVNEWQLVDLPDEYMEVYQKCVLGFVLAAAADDRGATYWLRVAADELAQIRALNNGRNSNRIPIDETPMVMNGTPLRYQTVPSGEYLLIEYRS